MLRRINVSFGRRSAPSVPSAHSAAVLHLLPFVLRVTITHAQHPLTPAHIYIINTRLLLYTRFAEFFIPFCAD